MCKDYIDRQILVDKTLRYKILSFLDSYSKCNQIIINPADAPKTAAFMTDGLNFYYKVMHFSIKNIEAKRQRLMDKFFSKQVGFNIEIYMTDMVIKTQDEESHSRPQDNI